MALPLTRLPAAVTLLACSTAASVFVQAGRSSWDAVYSDAQAARGAALYSQRCAGCHGGTLQGIEAAPALTGPTFVATWDGVPLGELSERIRISMPPDRPASLSRQQTADVLAYLLQVGRFPSGSLELPSDTTALNQITLRSAKP